MEQNIADLMSFDADFENFIKRYVNSFMKWEVVQFFHDHPRLPFKAEDLAEQLNRPAKNLKHELKELSKGGLLQEKKSGRTVLFVYDLSARNSRDSELKKFMDRFITVCQDREGRLRIIYKILKDGKTIKG